MTPLISGLIGKIIKPMAAEWLIGVAINVMGAATTNLGTVLMKFHTQKNHGVGLWSRIGLTLFILGSILTFVSFAYAAQSLLAGVSAVQFITNLFFAHFLLSEPFTRFNLIGTLVLICGIIMLVFASDKAKVASSVDSVFDDFFFTKTHLMFLISMVCLTSFLAFAFWFRTGVFPFWFMSAVPERRLHLELSLPRSRSPMTKIMIPILYVSMSALLGAQSVVSGKALSLVLSRQLQKGDWTAFKNWHVYVPLIAWFSTAFFWVVHMSRSLRIFSGVFVIPLTQVCWTLWTIISGGVVYGEFDDQPAWRLAIFTFGAVTLFGGVALLAPVYGPRLPTQPPSSRLPPLTVTMGDTQRHNDFTNMRKLMSTMSVDEMAAMNNSPRPDDAPSSAPRGRAIVFGDRYDFIPNPPYIRFMRWLKKQPRKHPKSNSMPIPDTLGHVRSNTSI